MKDCDLLVGIFWTRLGTPTGEAVSGTVEEIEKHSKFGKPAMIYFSSRPAELHTVDIDQYKALKDFKEQCKLLGLIEHFDNVLDLKEKFFRQLQLCINKNDYLKDIFSKNSPAIAQSMTEPPDPTHAVYRLSEEAVSLLKAAATGEDGTIMAISVMGGKFIKVAGQVFGGSSGRENARWEHAVNELINEGLIVARGSKGEVFELTHAGWRFADEIRGRTT